MPRCLPQTGSVVAVVCLAGSVVCRGVCLAGSVVCRGVRLCGCTECVGRQLLRGGRSAGRCRTTVRLLESLLRLTQAHARLRCSPEGRLCDAVVAVTLMEASLAGLGGGLLPAHQVGSILHTGFPDSPTDEYRAQCEYRCRAACCRR